MGGRDTTGANHVRAAGARQCASVGETCLGNVAQMGHRGNAPDDAAVRPLCELFCAMPLQIAPTGIEPCSRGPGNPGFAQVHEVFCTALLTGKSTANYIPPTDGDAALCGRRGTASSRASRVLPPDPIGRGKSVRLSRVRAPPKIKTMLFDN